VRRTPIGAACWLAQPVYVVVELLVALGASAAYALRDDTVSALGMLACAPGHTGSTVEVCSGWHVVLNAAFVVFGVLRAAGAVLLRPRLGAAGWGRLACGLWLVSSLSAAAVGLLPVDQVPGAHAVAALPVFALQPLAVLATAEALRRSHAVAPGVVAAGFTVGVLTLAAATGFAARLGQPTWVGGLERLALWPVYAWLAVVAAELAWPTARRRRAQRTAT
jgi:hypothetical protein